MNVFLIISSGVTYALGLILAKEASMNDGLPIGERIVVGSMSLTTLSVASFTLGTVIKSLG